MNRNAIGRLYLGLILAWLGSPEMSSAQTADNIRQTALGSEVIAEHPIPTTNSGPVGIVRGPDGAFWFTERTSSKIGRIDPSSRLFSEYNLPSGSEPIGIVGGPDGALWFTEGLRNKIGRITVNGVITEYSIPTANSYPWGIIAGPDGALWFTENAGNKIGRITTAGTITEYPIPTAGSGPTGLTDFTDGALWFTGFSGNSIGRIDTNSKVFRTYPLPTYCKPLDIVWGGDGGLWFTEASGNRIGRIDVNGVISEYSIPTANSYPWGIAWGPDGAVWFTENSANNIGRITPNGTITEYPLPIARSGPIGIVSGPDDSFWFAESAGGKIGRISLYPDPGPVINLFAADATTIQAGQTTTLRWSVSNVSTVFIDRIGTVAAVGTATVGPTVTTTYTLTATAGGVSPTAAVTISVQAAIASQTIAFPALSNVTLGVAPFTITAIASSGLPVSFVSTTPGVCTVSFLAPIGPMPYPWLVTIVGAGTCSITASQSGGSVNPITGVPLGRTYAAAPPVTRTFTVARSPSTSGVTVTSVGNGASFDQTFTPGMLMSVFGTGLSSGSPQTVATAPLPLTSSSGTSVTINGIAAPLMYISTTQINLQIPYEVATGSAVLIVKSGGQSGSISFTVQAAAPGIFVNSQNKHVVPNESAAAGSTIGIYTTGAGQVTPPEATGNVPAATVTPRPDLPVTLTVGGVPAALPYVGIPSWSVGVLQINFTVPASVPSGTQPVVVKIGGFTSQTAFLDVSNSGSAAPVISSFTASPSSIQAGQSSTLQWTVSNATTLSLNNGIGTVSGSSRAVSPSATTIYTLTASNSRGSITASTTVTIATVSAPTITSFTASPPSITAGQSSTLNWSVTNATSVSIDNGIGTVTGSSRAVSPATTTTYKLTATNGASGSVTATTTVTVDAGGSLTADLGGGVRMDFVQINPGEFMMGCSTGDTECSSSLESPVHQVRITKTFQMGQNEVTQAQWQAVTGSNPSFYTGTDLPVDSVSWDDIQGFLQRMNARNNGYRYRLPTEAEWEYAARAGSTDKYGGGGVLTEIAWFSENSWDKTHSLGMPHPVGGKKANAWGLYDMLGNVWEWCQDWYTAYSGSAATDPTGESSGLMRVFRGGSWEVGRNFSRVSSRLWHDPARRDRETGFRCVRER